MTYGWFYTLHRLPVNSSPSPLPPSLLPHLLSLSTLESRPFHPPTFHLAWKTRPAPSQALLIGLTSLAMWLLNLFSCVFVYVCVCRSHTLWSFSPLPVVTLPPLYPLSAVGPPHPVALSLSVGQCQGVRRGRQLGMGMMGGVLIAVTA